MRISDWSSDVCSSDLAEAELDALREPFAFARNGNRSLVASMNQRRHEAWTQFAYNRLTAFDVALRMLETPFSRKDLGRGFHFAANLLQARLLPATKIVASRSEERRVGNEWVRPCRSRWSTYH